jgi:calcium-dependent protein kinase
VKTIDKKKMRDCLDMLVQEIGFIKDLDHPNIISIYDVYEDWKYIYMVIDYCRGGELFDRIIKVDSYNEKDAAGLMRQIIMAVNYLHSRGIVHRDLKPDNFLFETDMPDSGIKLIDFGFSKRFEDGLRNMETMCGTPYYMSPDVIAGSYGKESDVWSIGVIMFVMLS